MAEPEFNPDEYREHIEAFDLTREQQDELLLTLWNIMKSFVEMGFGVDSIHYFIPGLKEEYSVQAPDTVDSVDKINRKNFERAAKLPALEDEST